MSEMQALRQDISEELIEEVAPYLARARQITGVTEVDALFYLKELIDGVLLSGKILANLSYQYSKAKTDRKRAEAVAYLEKYPEFAKERGGKKGTVAEIEAFVLLDEDVDRATENERYMESLYSYMLNVKQSLTMAHDDLKKAIYGRSMEMQNRTAHMG